MGLLEFCSLTICIKFLETVTNINGMYVIVRVKANGKFLVITNN